MDSNFLLKNLSDGTETTIERIDWLEWDTDNSKNKRFGSVHTKPLVGRSLIIDMKPLALELFEPGNYEKVSFTPKYTAIIDEITEILEQRSRYMRFETKTGSFELYTRLNTNKRKKGTPVGE